MTEPEQFDEAEWAAERRDFVADRRDQVAQRRDETADRRDLTADRREIESDEREARLEAYELHLDERATAMGLQTGRTSDETALELAQRDAARRERGLARAQRALDAEDRTTAATAREAASAQRELDNPTARLATAFAELAKHLSGAGDTDEVLSRIVAAAVSTIDGCEMASVTLREGVGYRTAVSTHDDALRSDRAQYDAGEGPCIDAVDTQFVYAPVFPDARWPVLADRIRRLGAESVASFQLSAPARAGEPLEGSLNAYAGERDAFDEEAQQIGLVLAAHASVAAAAMRQHEALEDMGRQLHDAL